MNLWSRLFRYQIVKTTRITDCVSVQVLPKQIQTNIRFLELQKAFEIVRRWTSDIGLLGVGVWRLHELPIVFQYKFYLKKFQTKFRFLIFIWFYLGLLSITFSPPFFSLFPLCILYQIILFFSICICFN